MNQQKQDKHIRAANALFKESLIYISPARGSGLQTEATMNLENFLAHNAAMKAAAVDAGNEDFANVCLGLECVATALRAEISMWLLLKQDQPDAAWRELVTAEMAFANAIKAHRGFEHMEDHVERLDALESMIFPPQVYLSIGAVVHRKLCSICQDDYANCDHISGRPYWGEFCHTILKDVVPDHVAIVEEPANKLCRVTHFDDAGGRRNRMTWKVEPKPGDPGEPAGGLTTNGIIATALPGRDGVQGFG